MSIHWPTYLSIDLARAQPSFFNLLRCSPPWPESQKSVPTS